MSEKQPKSKEELNMILDELVGVLPDTGKTLEEYRDERIKENYELVDGDCICCRTHYSDYI